MSNSSVMIKVPTNCPACNSSIIYNLEYEYLILNQCAGCPLDYSNLTRQYGKFLVDEQVEFFDNNILFQVRKSYDYNVLQIYINGVNHLFSLLDFNFSKSKKGMLEQIKLIMTFQ